MEPIPPWPPSRKTFYVILRWDSDRPAVYLGHRFNWWRIAFGAHPKAKFAQIDMHSREAHRFSSEGSARMCCDAMPDLVRLKHFLSIAELRDL